MTLEGRLGQPSSTVIHAFGAEGPAALLRGGRGTSWRAGHLVLKPADRDLGELEWEADAVASFDGPDVRLARPVRAQAAPEAGRGPLVVDGWTATGWLAGAWEPRWSAIIAAGQRLHAGLAGHPRPRFLDRRTDPWAVAERVAWGEADLEASAGRLPLIAELLGRRRLLHEPSQLVHGDLTGNVLFHDPDAPAVIDLALYWRPTGYATAVILADALAWHGAGPEVLELTEVAAIRDLGQHLIRGLLFRVVTDLLSGSIERVAAGDGGPYAPVSAAVRRLVSGPG